MKWFNSKKGKLPQNGQQVSIIVDGKSYNATFDATDKTFNVKYLDYVSFNPESKIIYWAEN